MTSSILKALFNLPSDTLLNDSNHFLSLTNTIINVRHLENYILQDEKTLLQSKIATFGRDMSPMLFVFYAKLSFKTLGVNSLDQVNTNVLYLMWSYIH